PISGFYKDIPIVIVLKLFRKKIIFHFHNKGVSLRQDRSFDNLLYKYVFKKTQCILLSKYLYSDIQKYVKEENTYYCANGIPVSESSVTHVEDQRLSRPFQILFLSNMMEEKGVWVLLEACHLMKKRGIHFECHFVGAWSDIKEPEFKSKIQSFGLENIVFSHGKKYA